MDKQKSLNPSASKANLKDVKDVKEGQTSLNAVAELTLRDQIMELEEKIHFGNLGILKVSKSGHSGV